jgi:hypothetical protein
MSNQLHSENLPKIVARCSLDTQYEAWILDNASVSINDPEGTPFMLNPERAYNLLVFLYRNRDMLHPAVQKPGELPERAKQGEVQGQLSKQRPGFDAEDLSERVHESWSNYE